MDNDRLHAVCASNAGTIRFSIVFLVLSEYHVVCVRGNSSDKLSAAQPVCMLCWLLDMLLLHATCIFKTGLSAVQLMWLAQVSANPGFTWLQGVTPSAAHPTTLLLVLHGP